MTAYNIIDPESLVSGQPQDVTVVLANFEAVQSIINGNLDNGNIRPSAGIDVGKLANYPGDYTKYLRGDGFWGVTTYTHTQVSPSATWTIPHNLSRFPAVAVVDSGGTEVLPNIQYIDTNNLIISFDSPTSGKAYLN
jgi:hypothetical protein